LFYPLPKLILLGFDKYLVRCEFFSFSIANSNCKALGSGTGGSNINVIQSKHNNMFNNVKFTTCFGYSNHHQVYISVHGQDMFSAYSMESILFTIAV